MPKLIPLKASEVIRKLKKLGFQWPIHWWRHSHMVKGNITIPVPLHWNKDLKVGLISMMINEIGISRDEWMEL